MTVYQKELQIKLSMLESLSRSQHALSRILQSVADIVQSSPELAQHIGHHIEVLSFYQRVLADRLLTKEIRKKQSGNPGSVWLSSEILPLQRQRGNGR